MEIVESGTRGEKGFTLGGAAFEYSYDKTANLEKLSEFVTLAGQKGVDLLVFPEQSVQGYVWESEMAWELTDDVLQYHYVNSETVPGPVTDMVAGWAAEYGMLIAFGLTERHPYYGKGKGGLYNSAVLVSGEGVLGVHRKVHICGTEKHIYQPGRSFEVIGSDVGRVGMLVCYDMVFPEAARTAAVQGADILVFMADWARAFDPPLLSHLPSVAEEDQNHFLEILLGIRAFENQVWIVFGSAAGSDARSLWEDGGSPKQYQGQARIVDPQGVTRAATSVNSEGLAIAYGCDIDGAILESRTKAFWGDSFMYDRRPVAYDVLTNDTFLYSETKGFSVHPSLKDG